MTLGIHVTPVVMESRFRDKPSNGGFGFRKGVNI